MELSDTLTLNGDKDQQSSTVTDKDSPRLALLLISNNAILER